MTIDLDDAERKMIARVMRGQIADAKQSAGALENNGASGAANVVREGIRIAENIIRKMETT